MKDRGRFNKITQCYALQGRRKWMKRLWGGDRSRRCVYEWEKDAKIFVENHIDNEKNKINQIFNSFLLNTAP